MSDTVIKIENLSKIYRLGEVGTGTLSHDLNRWWKMNVMRQDDPYAKIGHVNDRTQKAEKGELVAALRNINLEVKQGEVLGIIGKNGAGKSTLLKLLSRVTSPTSGTIKTKGRLASLLEVGTGFHPEMTGRENIYMNGTIMGMRKWEIDKKLDEIIDFAGVAKYIDTPTKRYSSGMTVRLGFAIAAFLEPEILIVDEVLAVGDAEFQKKAIGKMQDISSGQGRTVLFVSHNMASIANLCKNGFVLNNGTSVFTGSVEDSIDYYLTNSIDINTNSSLKDRKDRRGNGEILFSDFYVTDEFDNLIDKIPSGKNIKFVLEYTCNVKVKNIDVGISIHTRDNSVLSVNYLSYYGKSFDELNGSGKFFFSVNDFPFREGHYRIGARLLTKNNESDFPENGVGEIEVIHGDFYKSGNLNLNNSAPVLINGKWEAK